MSTPFLDGEASILITTLAERLRRHLTTVHRWRQTGQLECVRVGGRWTVSLDAWQRFLARCNPPEQAADSLPICPTPNRATKRHEAELAKDDERAVALGL
jgi:hypothetical protein